ncbi:hypothetical protein BKA93DRAFT_813471 [Sparassis latifolia]
MQIPSTQTEEQDSGLEAEFGGSSMPEDVPKAETMQQPLTEAAPLSFHAGEWSPANSSSSSGHLECK